MSQACSILAWKAKPTSTPAQTSERRRPDWTARMVASAASTSSRMRSVSEMLPRSSRITIGLTASTSAATMPAPAPPMRRTAR